MSKSYGDLDVLKHVDLMVERAKVAFVGQNGQGKSTLAKNFSLRTFPEGMLSWGIMYKGFCPNQAEHLMKDGFDTMIDEANETNRSKVIFRRIYFVEVLEKYVSVLSEGERNRLALAKLLLNH